MDVKTWYSIQDSTVNLKHICSMFGIAKQQTSYNLAVNLWIDPCQICCALCMPNTLQTFQDTLATKVVFKMLVDKHRASDKSLFSMQSLFSLQWDSYSQFSDSFMCRHCTDYSTDSWYFTSKLLQHHHHDAYFTVRVDDVYQTNWLLISQVVCYFKSSFDLPWLFFTVAN